MIDLAKVPKRPHQFVQLNTSFWADLGWWHVFIEGWNGISVIPVVAKNEVVVTSDASGSWGCSAWSQTSWFQYKWPEHCNHHISFKELLAQIIIIIAAATWGGGWSGMLVRWKCDNQAAVNVLATCSCRDASMTHILRCLFFYEAHYQFSVMAVHLAGRDNELADDLSRDRHISFLSKAPHMDRAPSSSPPPPPSSHPYYLNRATGCVLAGPAASFLLSPGFG